MKGPQMNVWPQRRTKGVGSRLVAIRTDVGQLGSDLRGLADDLADIAVTGAGRVVHPAAQTLNTISGRLNGRNPGRGRNAAMIAASVGAVALIGGLIVGSGALNGRSFLSA